MTHGTKIGKVLIYNERLLPLNQREARWKLEKNIFPPA